MANIIQLGIPLAVQQDYTLEQVGDGIAWERGPANPFAAKVSTNSKYDEIDIWNDWVQEDWQGGVGRIDPEEGGFFFSESETRVPNQVILPPLMQRCDTRTINNTSSDCRYMPTAVTGTITVGSGGHVRAAMAFTTPGTVPASVISSSFYCRADQGTTIKVSIYSNSAGSPNALITTTTIAFFHPDKNFHWLGNILSTGSLSGGTLYWLVIEPVNASHVIEVAYGTSGYDTAAKGYNGSAWASISSTYLFYRASFHRLNPAVVLPNSIHMRRFNNVLYVSVEEELYKYDSVNEQFDSVGTITGSGDVTSLAVFGPTLHIGRSSGNYTTMSTSEAFSATAYTRNLLVEYDGYLYAAYENDLYYSVDGSTWSDAFQVGSDAYSIRGIAGMGSDLYMATDKCLFRFAPGEVVEEVASFGAIESSNGVGMMGYQGSLFIPAAGRLFRFDQSGQMMDIWLNRDDDLLLERIGRIASLEQMNNWLVAYVIPVTSENLVTAWAWQDEGWHFLSNVTITGTFVAGNFKTLYDRATQRLWFTSSGGGPDYMSIPDYAFNPYNLTDYKYQPYGWLEQDRFYGGQYLLDKSWESVTIVADNLSANVHVKVYWQDEGSTTWELLGTADTDGEELRWSNYTTRPSGRWIKLGLLLQSNTSTETPRVRAVTVKFLPFPNDRIVDNVTLTLKSNNQMPDGTPDEDSLATQLAHIQSLIASVNPIIYRDIFDVRYEVAITSWRMIPTRFHYINNTKTVLELRVPLVLEQLPDTTYG